MATNRRTHARARIVLLTLCCLPFTAVAEGEWVLSGGKNDGTYRIYVRSDVKRLGNGLVEGWEVWDYKEPQSDAALKITYRSGCGCNHSIAASDQQPF
jgi:hypothetical protein